MTIRWYGLVAPEEVPTGDRRMFAARSLTFRDFPLPAAWQRVSGSGHANSVVVASWDHSYAGDGGMWGRGEFLDPAIVPEVVEAIYLLDKGLIGPSVDLDPDLAYEVVEHPSQPEQLAMKVMNATVHGLTFVMGPAFPQVHITVENDDEYTILASAGITHLSMIGENFQVNKTSWQSWPIAPRETKFDADDAIARIAQWSGGDPKKFAKAFLYYDPTMPATNRESYRLPVADVHNGVLALIPRAVFSAATILSGAHGGLPDVPDEQKILLQEIITEMYDMLREEYGDPRTIPPWQRGGREGATSSEATPTEASMDGMSFQTEDTAFQSRLTGPLRKYWIDGEGAAKVRWGTPGSFDRCVRALRDDFPRDTEGLCANLHHEATGKWPSEGKGEHSMSDTLTAAVRSSGWSSMPIGSGSWDKGAALAALNSWAGDDMSKYARAFLWVGEDPSLKTSYKFPIAKPVDGTLTIIPAAVNNADARLGGADIPAADKARIQSILNTIQARMGAKKPATTAAMDSDCPEGQHKMPDGTCMDDEDEEMMYSISAASAPTAPPAAWFENPKLSGPTKKVVTDQGQVYGHLASFKTCHLGVGSTCTRAPKSKTGYQYFKQGAVKLDDGSTIEVGKLTIGAGHADSKYGIVPATEHYDNAACAVAIVNVGEDKFGVWFAGAVVPNATNEQVAQFRAAALSGDWRRVDGNLELVAALAVNSPGFPIIEADSLTAAGVLVEDAVVAHEFDLSGVDQFLTLEDRRSRREEMAKIFGDGSSPEGCGCDV